MESAIFSQKLVDETIRDAVSEYILNGNDSTYGDIAQWDTSGVTNMSQLFHDYYGTYNDFNGNINGWNVTNVTNMYNMFGYAKSFNEDISCWDVSKVKDMRWIFSYAYCFNSNISQWNVSNVTDMDGMFDHSIKFNCDIGNWDVSRVTSMSMMFSNANSFNGDISRWNVRHVTNMMSMFSNATSFSGDISLWDISNVRVISHIFNKSTSFHNDVSLWNVNHIKKIRNKIMCFKKTTTNIVWFVFLSIGVTCSTILEIVFFGTYINNILKKFQLRTHYLKIDLQNTKNEYRICFVCAFFFVFLRIWWKSNLLQDSDISTSLQKLRDHIFPVFFLCLELIFLLMGLLRYNNVQLSESDGFHEKNVIKILFLSGCVDIIFGIILTIFLPICPPACKCNLLYDIFIVIPVIFFEIGIIHNILAFQCYKMDVNKRQGIDITIGEFHKPAYKDKLLVHNSFIKISYIWLAKME